GASLSITQPMSATEWRAPSNELRPLAFASRRRLARVPLPDHAVHADHRARHQLERQEPPFLDPAGKLDIEREIAAKAELIVVLGIADQDDAAVAQHARLRHRVPHQRLAVTQDAQLGPD